ncbi:MAG: hypothetical protein JWN86_77 [Planctomycetota bacterium]|nr:hypothetical protein [Planctomycetota bacterium]
MGKDAPPRRRRRLVKVLGIVVVFVIVMVVALPSFLGTSPARRWLLTRINRSLSPGSVEVKSLHFSWFGPILAEGLVLRSSRGEGVIIAPKASWDRGLWHLITDRPRYGSVSLEGAKVDLARRIDGTINLAEALGFRPNPGVPTTNSPPAQSAAQSSPEITLKIVNGSLRLQSPELTEPMIAERLDLTIRVPTAKTDLTWQVGLTKPTGETLEIAGALDRAAGASGLTVNLKAHHWPAAFSGAGLLTRGRLDGKIEIRRRGDDFDVAGDARILDLDSSGPALAGDRVAMKSVGGVWDVSRGSAGWTIRALDLRCPVASLIARGGIPATSGHPTVIEGQVNLAALARQVPHAMRLREGLDLQSGLAAVRVDVRELRGAQHLDVVARISDLTARDRSQPAPFSLPDPATITAALVARGSQVQVETLGVKSNWLQAEGSGTLDRGVHVLASIDLAAMRRELKSLIDFQGIEIGGLGRLEADYRREGNQFQAKLKGDVRDLTAIGLTSSPIQRPILRLDGDASGQVDVTGLPVTWRTARLGLGTDDLAASVSIAPREDGLNLWIAGSMPTTLASGPGRVEARAAAIWTGTSLDIGELHADLKSAETASSLGIAARGRFDMRAGTIVLEPLPSTPANALSVAPGGIRISGLNGSDADLTMDGGLVGDLAAVDRTRAAWVGGTAWGLDGASGLALKAVYRSKDDRLNLTELVVATRYGSTGLAGTVSDLSGRRVADLHGALALDGASVNAFVASAGVPDARIELRPRAISLRGALAGGSTQEIMNGLEGELGLELARAEGAGLRLGPANIVAHVAGGKVAIDPIQATLNGGRVELRPELVLDDPRGMTLKLLNGTAIQNAVIDEDVTKRLLSYLAPILHDATRVRGKLSVAIERAEFPIGGSAERSVSLEGRVDFQDLTFGPGPLAREVLDLAVMGRQPEVTLSESIAVKIANRRVQQRGLTIPVGRKERILIDGSVGFDRSLALKAEVPLPASALGNRAGLKEALAEVRIPVTIGGTLSRPQVDRRALSRALRDEGRSTLRREAESGASELLRRLGSDAAPKRR